MINSEVNNKPTKVPLVKNRKLKIKNNNKIPDNSFLEGSTSSNSSRVDQLALPPIRTLMQNQEQFKHILTTRGAKVLEQKIKQTIFSRYGRSQDPYGPDLIIEQLPVPKTVRQTTVYKKKDTPDPISKAIKTPLAVSRIELLSKPLRRRLPSAVSFSPEKEICHVKPSTLQYVPNERILELSQPKKLYHKMAKKISKFRVKNKK